MRDDNGAERPGSGIRRKARMASAMGSRKVFFITARAPPGSPRFHALCRGIQRSRRRHCSKTPRGDKQLSCPCKTRCATSRNPLAWPAEPRFPSTNLLDMARQRAVFPRDPGLQARMLLTLFLLGLLYVVFIAVLLQAGAGLVTVVVVIGALSLAQLFFSDKLALSAMGAKVVSPQEAPGLHAMIEKLCIQADLPKPRIAVADTEVPNAFATGRSQKSATVCATTGIMRTLSPSELEGVMAHELAHVKHRDVLIMTIASFFASLAATILQFGFFFGGGGMDSDDDNPSFLVILLVSFVVYVVSFFLMMALSRYREFAADRGSAIVTGRPSALASALVKISSQVQRLPQRDLREAERLERMNAFFIVPVRVKSALQSLFSTHPPMEKRIERLQQLERSLQGTLAA